jgi:hypothetical protein
MKIGQNEFILRSLIPEARQTDRREGSGAASAPSDAGPAASLRLSPSLDAILEKAVALYNGTASAADDRVQLAQNAFRTSESVTSDQLEQLADDMIASLP